LGLSGQAIGGVRENFKSLSKAFLGAYELAVGAASAAMPLAWHP
jgi:hypothetical protein